MSKHDNTDRDGKTRARVLYVTGKGGVGKTTLTDALCLAANDNDQRTARVTLGDSSTVQAPPAGVIAVELNGERALAHLLERVLLVRVLARRVLASRTFNAVAAAAPGLADLVMLGFLDDLATGNTEVGRLDLVVVDGFAAGHARAMLEAPIHAAELIGKGPGRDLVDRCRRLTTDSRHFQAVVVASPEELPVLEAGELWRALEKAGIGRLPPIVNGLYPSLLNDEQARYVRALETASEARWYESTCTAQRGWAQQMAALSAEGAVELEHDFADGRIAAERAAALLECRP